MTLIKMVSVDEEMRRNKDLKKSDLQILRDWYEKQPHLPEITDSELILFFHSNYYRLEPTKITLDNFYTIRTHVPEFFADRDPLGSKGLREIINVITCVPLSQTTAEGYKIIFGKLIDFEPSHFDFAETTKFSHMTLDLMQYTEGTSQGHVIVNDVSGVVFGHVGRLSLSGLKKSLYYLQEALPIRLKSVHLVNTSPVMDMILNMAKPFLKKELLDMIHMHSSMDSLAKYIPLESLPNEQGGKAGPLMDLHAANLKRIEQHREWFQEEEVRARVNETLRPGKAKNTTELFGVEGSFKKLDID